MAATLKAATNAAAGSNEIISISIDSMTTGTVGAGPLLGNGKEESSQQLASQQPMVLSKKALHQRDADENLFLRFLELDPPADGNANSTTTGTTAGTTGTAGTGSGAGAAGGGGSASAAANSNASNANHMNGGGSNSSTRRCSTMPGYARSATSGRTPFTMTKRLTRTEERGFGFSIVWTHPPRVEKVEAGLSADRCGILPGDYVIFVDKHNVVTMPEADVLNLIRSQGSTLTLEIFRRSGAGANNSNSHSHRERENAITTLGSSSLNATHSQSQSHTQQHALGVGVASEEPPQLAVAAVQRSNSTAAAQRTTPQLLLLGNNQQSRPATACSGTTSSIEAAKRRLHLPQVTFSKEVGKGVIV